MTIAGKLALIKLCCTNKEKYKHGTMLKFWTMIKALLKQENGIDFASPRQTVERWCEMESQALIDEEMESGTTHDKDDFRERVEEFLEHMSEIKSEREDKKKTMEEKVEEAETVARVQQTLLAGMDKDDEDYDSAQSSSLHYKKRRKTEGSQLDVATVVVEGMKESMATLGSSLKEAMAGTSMNNDRVKQLEKDNEVLKKDNEVLKERTSSILDLLQEMRNKM